MKPLSNLAVKLIYFVNTPLSTISYINSHWSWQKLNNFVLIQCADHEKLTKKIPGLLVRIVISKNSWDRGCTQLVLKIVGLKWGLIFNYC